MTKISNVRNFFKKNKKSCKKVLTNGFLCNIIAFVEWKETHTRVGVFSDEGPPVPIPNTEVKLISADNTWLEAAREDKAMPTQ